MMSDQQALDCTYSDNGNYDGCGGGWYTPVWQRISSHLGNQFPTAASYQYKEKDTGSCTVGRGVNALNDAKVATVYSKSVPYISQQSGAPYDSSLAAAVAIGPVAVAIEVTNPMYAYSSGTYSETCTGNVNHAVVVVGYDSASFLIRNSWGSTWGEKGYINFDRSIQNQCFIAQYPEYPNMEVIEDGEDNGGDGEEATEDSNMDEDDEEEGDGGEGNTDDKATEASTEEATEAATTESPDPCDPNPCQNNGKCKSFLKGKKKGTYKCKCKKKYTGDQCQERIIKCKDKSSRCADLDRNHKKCQKNWAKKKCQMTCGLCFM